MPRPEKVEAVQRIKEKIRRAQGLVLTDFRGLNVPELEALRDGLRKTSAEYRVVKNTLLAIAADELGLEGLERYLVGPTAIAIGYDDPVTPARVVHEFIRQYRKLEVKGGVVEGKVVDADTIKALADLPARPELIARVVGGARAPLYGLVGVLTGLQRSLVGALDQIRQKRAAGGA
ncbi:MAG: 50S ribosomal protein L10 [Armatimonadota bacterium]|nr:50S ribosomal protein L10 [Armatimonadota bacterium]MDR5697659.1 50S ribosomal protein L10 [Armatimonadota bacterium]